MKVCPTCATTFDRSRSFCPQDGAELELIASPAALDDADQPFDTRPMKLAVARKVTAMLADGRTSALSADEALIGQVVAERYQIESLIGRGGMGIVYRARHLMLGRHIAIKFLRHQFINDERAVGRFMREAQAMARIDHPNAAHVYDFGVLPNGVAYLAMEMIEGEPLRSILARSGPLEWRDGLAVMDQVCGAVEAAHREGVIHRDLKPENIMLKQTDAGAVVKVVDFGLAKIADGSDSGSVLTAAGELFGTPAYMAPEFFQGEVIDARADVYALGSIMFEVLTGAPPFQGTVQTVIGSQLFKDPAPLVDLVEDVPQDMSHAVALALSKSRDERPESAVAFAALLRGSHEPYPSAGLPAAIATIVVQPIAEVTGTVISESDSSAVTFDPRVRSTSAHGVATDRLSTGGLVDLVADDTGQVDLSAEAMLDTPDAGDAVAGDPPTLAIEAPPARRHAATAAVSVFTAVSLVGLLAASYREAADQPARALDIPAAAPAPVMPSPVESAADESPASDALSAERRASSVADDAPAVVKPSRTVRPRMSSANKAAAEDRAGAKLEGPKADRKAEKKRRWFDPRRWF